MKDISEKTKQLLNSMDAEDKYFFGRIPSLKEIESGLVNLKLYNENNFLGNKKIIMNEIKENRGEVIGYNSFTLLNNANATPYEKEFIDMGKGLDYFYIKKIFVHPDFREQGIGTGFIEKNLSLSKKLDKHVITDVEKNNYKIINLLTNQNFSEDFNWVSRNGMEMIRFFHE